jgi:spoIIIJ-associated protein
MKVQEIIEQKLSDIFKYLDIDPNISIEQDEEAQVIKIDGKDLNFLIGYQGQSLDALQTLVGQMVLKETGEWTPLNIDINGYKDKKTDKIEEITKRYIDKVRFFENAVPMPPMKPWERRQVHMFVADYEDITSESEGRGRGRRVVLKPSKR